MRTLTIAAIAATTLLLAGCGAPSESGNAPAPAPAPATPAQILNVQYVTVATEDGGTVPCVIILDSVEDAGGITCDWANEG